ncbi:MAG: hypothetical protein Q9219_003444 [cf. Caloplaca sp. 3 TL-2023]
MLQRSYCLLNKNPYISARRTIFRPSSSAAKPPAHHDLPSFLAYADSTSLSPTSSLYIGTRYEYLCAATLRRLSFNLIRTGGRSDHGIDLLGHWHLPSLPYPLRALVQCKALKSKPGPSLVRELEGMYAGAPAGWRASTQNNSNEEGEANNNVIAVLCAKREATKGVREAVRRSKVPVVWVMVEDLGGEEGKVRQVLWNERVREVGAEGVGVGVRYALGEGEVGKEVRLTWKGEVWEPDVEVEAKGDEE